MRHSMAWPWGARRSCLSFSSPDLACLVTRSSRRSTWSRSATSSSSRSVSRSSAGTRVPENPSSTTKSASTWRRLPSSSGPVPRTSTTRIAAGVTLRGRITSPIRARRGSGIAAMPTSPVARAPVRAWNSVDFPELGSPTIPTSSATTTSSRSASATTRVRDAGATSPHLRSCRGSSPPRNSEG